MNQHNWLQLPVVNFLFWCKNCGVVKIQRAKDNKFYLVPGQEIPDEGIFTMKQPPNSEVEPKCVGESFGVTT